MRKSLLEVILLVLLAFVGVANLTHADPFDTWSWRYPIPQGRALHAITFANGQFVAVGDYGTILTSTNGTNWTIQTAGQFPQLLGVGAAGGSFAAVGAGGVIVTSSNGVNWTQQTSPTMNTLRSVAGYSNSVAVYAAVGDSGTVVTTADGTNWFTQPVNTTSNLTGVASRLGRFFIVGTGVYIANPTGQFAVSQINPAYFLQSIDYANGKQFIGGYIAYSSLALFPSPIVPNSTWTNVLPPYGGQSDFFTISGVAFGNNVYAAIGYSAYALEYNHPGLIATSPDGTNWTYIDNRVCGDFLYGVTYGNGVFVAVGEAGSIVVSSDGLNWTDITGLHRTAITAIACSENLCIAAGQEAKQDIPGYVNHNFSTLVSSNGIDWSVSTTNLPCLFDLVSSGNTFVGVSGTCTYTTTNGFNWSQNCISTNNLRGVGHGAGKFFAVGDQGAIFTSPDGLAWSDHSLATTGGFNSAAYGNGVFYAEGSITATSSDGVSWALYPTNPPGTVSKMIFANGIFVAAIGPTFNGTQKMYYSVNGLIWQTQDPQEAIFAGGLTYVDGSFVILNGNYGTYALVKSTDGINWTQSSTNLPFPNSYWGLYYFTSLLPFYPRPALCAYKGTLLVGGFDGVLMQSGSALVPIATKSPQLGLSGFTFSFAPPVGGTFRVQAATNFSVWSNIYSGIGTAQPTNFTDPSPASYSSRYFRVVTP